MTPELPRSLVLTGDGAVRRLTIDRPDHANALDDDARLGLLTALSWFETDPVASVLVLTGAGETFSAGGDLDDIERLHHDEAYRDASMAEARELVEAMLGSSKPVIAAVNGPAVGLGCTITQLCDVVLAAPSAFFADPHVAVGLVAGDGGALLWPLAMGPLRAKELLFTGDRVPAAEAVALGLATRVVPAAELLGAAHALAERLAALPQLALRGTKQSVNRAVAAVAAEVMAFSTAAEARSAASPDLLRRVEALRRRG